MLINDAFVAMMISVAYEGFYISAVRPVLIQIGKICVWKNYAFYILAFSILNFKFIINFIATDLYYYFNDYN